MKFYVLLLLFTQHVIAPNHDVPVAIFDMKIEDDGITMNVKLDKEDLEEAIIFQFDQTISQELIEQYILKNTEWTINEKKITLKINTIQKDNEHYLIKMDFPIIKEKLESMSIYNTCLVNEIDSHSNIIYLRYQNEKRGFRLDKDRKRTSFEL